MPSTHFVDRSVVARRLNGRSIAIVGSGPGLLGNAPGFVDSHDVVVRVNNYRCTGDVTGFRADVHYSFYGTSIKKTAWSLAHEGVKLCMCKCPNALAINSDWHRRNNRMEGVDFRRIYERRARFWFCDTYIPSLEDFLIHFYLLGGHVPTTGFSAILDVLSFAPKSVYLTGFDFFRSQVHNLNEPWRQKNRDDPICHVPEREAAWLRARVASYPITCDTTLNEILEHLQ